MSAILNYMSLKDVVYTILVSGASGHQQLEVKGRIIVGYVGTY